MNWSKWIRQIHRWVAIAFTLTVIANFVAMTQGQPPAWVTYSPLLPLFLLLFTGLYMFVLPYATSGEAGHHHRWRLTISYVMRPLRYSINVTLTGRGGNGMGFEGCHS
jgi:hypothetical protein